MRKEKREECSKPHTSQYTNKVADHASKLCLINYNKIYNNNNNNKNTIL